MTDLMLVGLTEHQFTQDPAHNYFLKGVLDWVHPKIRYVEASTFDRRQEDQKIRECNQARYQREEERLYIHHS